MAKRFDRALEAATDQTLVEPYWEGILECVDLIRAGDVPVKAAVASIQKRFHHENPHVAHHGLLVLEACVKNCGKKFHNEISTKEFMDDLKNMVIEGAPDKVKNKILELLQCWSHAFSKYPQYKIVCDTHSFMKMYGFEFPTMKEADAMFMADSAPEWADGDNCFRCRSEFGVFNRKHHCRNCGQIFCGKCSNREMVLPQFGIEKNVRVCEACFTKKHQEIQKNELDKLESALNSHEAKAIAESEAEEKRRQQELKEKEEEELQLALAISQSEAEAKEKDRQRSFSTVKDEPTPSVSIYSGVAQALEPESDPSLAQYLDRDYWERRQASREIDASAPPASEISFSMASSYGQHNNVSHNATPTNDNIDGISQQLANITVRPLAENEVEDTAKFCEFLKDRIETMNNRMLSNMNRGRSIVYDSAIHALFEELTRQHCDVLNRIDRLDTDREYFESLQDKLSEIQVARQAVNSLREEHCRMREEKQAEEQRQRQHQMQMQLDLMRQKKASMLMQQRDEALSRFQTQQAEIQRRRMEAQYQHQHQMQGGYPPQYYPPGYPQQYPQDQHQGYANSSQTNGQVNGMGQQVNGQTHQVNGLNPVPSSMPSQPPQYGYQQGQIASGVSSNPNLNGYHQQSTPVSSVPSGISAVNSAPSMTDVHQQQYGTTVFGQSAGQQGQVHQQGQGQAHGQQVQVVGPQGQVQGQPSHAQGQVQHPNQPTPVQHQAQSQNPNLPPQGQPGQLPQYQSMGYPQQYGYQYPNSSAPQPFYGHPDPNQQFYGAQPQGYPGYYQGGYPPQQQAPAPQAPPPPADDAPLISFD
ncbi:unnamed protein product [Bursaphelenchus okinawaensis]|uniref:Hepatocyte growth factor-regulated tyrosine kinase substrate n=1 Tax=Bursaphelenchus okinawaensis TaxID=465554 RepID=A0A811L1J6_9BILA|nr:unnamed protein product [Bursaphelenchus okinawaensis]CAG9114827.1 unnamed protein product [Bursaphelenchus okinawaensis]